MSRIIDLRSDTFTLPTEAMYARLADATLGDDVYGEDPTVARLEAAAKTGKKAALLVTSGTQGHLVALLAQIERGSEVIVGASSDLYNAETGGICTLGGLTPQLVDDEEGFPSALQVRAAIRGADVHVGPSAALCLERTHQRAGGVPIPLEALAELAKLAHEHELVVGELVGAGDATPVTSPYGVTTATGGRG